jgi:rod shape-determining protein MreD
VTALKLSGLVVLALVVQVTVIAPVTVLGARGDIMLLVAIAAGFEGGPERGAWVGFATGLTLDLMLSTPAGLSAATFAFVAALVGTFHNSMIRTSRSLPALTAAVASAVGVVVYWVLASMLGRGLVLATSLPVVVLVVAAVNGALSPVVMRAVRWALRDGTSERITLR